MVATTTLILTFGGTAWAAPSEGAFTRLLKLNPGLSATELESSMHEAAAATGLTYDQAVTTALGEAEHNARSVGTMNSNPSCGGAAVGTARYKGDIFWSAASTYGIPHGHTGIYSERDWITEARGSGQNSGEFYYSGRNYCKTIEKMDVATSIAIQNQAADYASQYLTGKPYNSNFAWNKGGNIDTLNCSELVYKAYKRSVNIDLDGNGGLGVYPNDIRDSSETRTYEVIS
ncbi:YiiX/YebB-like N1pC/P60 family cysteine hydrolase [Polymorphospora rubra]|uniref:YiiX/YebB-like N1pC/P60 family cysteine hydrolase n=1 Tax=Polymorphospora rubra TaxID=338584 RepID=UPI001BB312D1|nr:YiiX/YebB-like N1pC/P60 family cysteine hydrolase [Polymorphospora rubra]